MKEKYLKEMVSISDLTEAQTEIVEAAIENPEDSYADIARRTGWSASYVSEVHRAYLGERIIPSEVDASNLTDGLFEIIVAGIQDHDEVERVERHYELDLNRGGSKEVDVAVWVSRGGHDFLLIIECKFHSEPIEQDVPAAMAWYQENSAANKAMVISRTGFQSGAIALARDAEIELYRLDELTREVGDDRIMSVNVSIEINRRRPEVLDIDLERLEDENYDEETIEMRVTGDDVLFDEDRNPVDMNLQEFARTSVSEMTSGTQYMDVDDRLILVEGDFYRLTGIQIRIEQLEPTEMGFEIDAYEEYDLYMEDVLEDSEQDLDLISVEEAISAFEEHVRH